MLIIEPETEAGRQNPLVEIYDEQLKQWVTLIDKQLEKTEPSDEFLYKTSDILCEGTRDLLFRLHRITMKDLKSVVDLFTQAAEKIQAVLERATLTDPQEKDVKGYLAHVNGRINILKKYTER